jgi:uncharacterized protein YdeI (YjbR/CyaY-like superfamily)
VNTQWLGATIPIAFPVSPFPFPLSRFLIHDSVDHPHITPRSRREWRAWLKKHHTSATGVWVVYAKKHTGIPSLTWQEGVEEALCFGWIDSLRRAVDDTYFKQLYTPRKARSVWSAINKQTVARLIDAGLMAPAGLAAVETAKANGRWSALDDVESHTVPADFAAALARNEAAQRAFDSFTPFIRKLFLYRLNSAKRPETRARRITELVAAAESGRSPFTARRAAQPSHPSRKPVTKGAKTTTKDTKT